MPPWSLASLKKALFSPGPIGEVTIAGEKKAGWFCQPAFTSR
jgi:hypothetical protein